MSYTEFTGVVQRIHGVWYVVYKDGHRSYYWKVRDSSNALREGLTLNYERNGRWTGPRYTVQCDMLCSKPLPLGGEQPKRRPSACMVRP